MKRPLLVPALALFGALASAQSGLGGRPWDPRSQVNFSVFRSGTDSRIAGQELIVLNTEAALQTYWSRSTGQLPQTAPRGVDWNRQKLVAVHLGTRPSGGYSVMIQNVERDGAYAIVRAIERQPVPGGWVSKGATNPYTIIAVDRNAANYRLEVTARSGDNLPNSVNVTLTGPGIVYNPSDYERPGGGGYVDPRFAVEFALYDQGQNASFRDGGLFVISSDFEMRRYWSRLTGRPNDCPRDIDWRSCRVVAVHLGSRRTAGYRVTVAGVERNGLTGIVRAVEETPIPGSFLRQSETTPYVLIRVPRNLTDFKLDLTTRPAGNVRIVD